MSLFRGDDSSYFTFTLTRLQNRVLEGRNPSLVIKAANHQLSLKIDSPGRLIVLVPLYEVVRLLLDCDFVEVAV